MEYLRTCGSRWVKYGGACALTTAALVREQATQAYIAGNKALAKELGAKGRWHAAQMASAHAQASSSIYRARNPAKGAPSAPSP